MIKIPFKIGIVFLAEIALPIIWTAYSKSSFWQLMFIDFYSFSNIVIVKSIYIIIVI